MVKHSSRLSAEGANASVRLHPCQLLDQIAFIGTETMFWHPHEAPHDLVHDQLRRRCAERHRACGQLVDGASEGPQVTPSIARLAGHHLRRQEVGYAHAELALVTNLHGRDLGMGGVPSRAETDQFELQPVDEQEVFAPNVAVHDARGMHGGESLDHLLGKPGALPVQNTATILDSGPQLAARAQIQDTNPLRGCVDVPEHGDN
mmetsp:Transcript_71813/g.199299  ORF Transcript_71813/g.199299 Transcript_71813/m.199299 type:complete len:204 (+) Transcript_71813:871-1482(+)